MPEFSPGESKTAIVTMSNPKAKPFDYTAELYMGTDLALMAGEDFHLEAEGSKDVSLPITMPSTPGTYPVHIGVFSGGQSIGLYKATEDVVIAAPDIRVEIARAYIRMAYPSVSEAYSGWISFTPGSELNLALFGNPIQVGVLLRNPTNAPLRYTPTIYNYHWIEPNNYTTDYLTLPTVEPVKFTGPPGQGNPPTGLPYSGYQYECDKFLPPGGELAPGQTGFVYTELFYQSRRWNNVYIRITSNGYDLGTVLLYSGWYSY